MRKANIQNKIQKVHQYHKNTSKDYKQIIYISIIKE